MQHSDKIWCQQDVLQLAKKDCEDQQGGAIAK